MDIKYEIYVIENLVNGKKYVGITTWGYLKRFTRHKSEARWGNTRPLYASMRKHGFDKFKISLVNVVDSWEELCEQECIAIVKFDSFIDNNGYNLTKGGEGTPGRILTEEHKQKILDTRSGWSDEKKDKVRQKQRAGVKQYWENANKNQLEIRNKKVSVQRKQYLQNRSNIDSNIINEKIRKTLQQKPSKRRVCTVDGVEYFSQSEASRQLNINIDTLRNRIQSKNYPTYITGKLYE